MNHNQIQYLKHKVNNMPGATADEIRETFIFIKTMVDLALANGRITQDQVNAKIDHIVSYVWGTINDDSNHPGLGIYGPSPASNFMKIYHFVDKYSLPLKLKYLQSNN